MKAIPEPFWQSAWLQILDHGMRDPIFSCHRLKTARAIEEEPAHTSPRSQTYLLASLHRFLRSPMKQKHTRRMVWQAMELVEK